MRSIPIAVKFEVMVILIFILFITRCPDKITLLRGNHESRDITRVYGFYQEIYTKYECADPWNWCVEVFDLLGIAAVMLSNTSSFIAGR